MSTINDKVATLGDTTLGLNIDKKEWIIQRQIDAAKDSYEDWPGYSEKLMSQYEMIQKLHDCRRRWPNTIFRGFNVVDTRCPSFRLEIL